MALFESYERRIDQINAELAKHGISSIEEAKQICDEKESTLIRLLKTFSPFVLRTLLGLTLSALQSLLRTALKTRLTLLKRSVSVSSPSVSRMRCGRPKGWYRSR